ncbi:hypothetical protein M970_051100 [Encephalitozoon cuniculi EcunIII-L]|nr:hypothetical protein M970_051100 [Encephalitozoon cuniculi EcunIII-L]
MNPFVEGLQFDSRLYEIVSKVGKRSEKTKLRGLLELKDVLDTVDVEANIDTLLEIVEDTIKSQNLQIKNLSIDVLYKLLSSVEDRSKFKKVLSAWLYGFIENPEYVVSRKIFAEFVDIGELEDEFVRMLDFKEDPVLGLVCLQLLVKKGRKDYSRMAAESIEYLDLNSPRELREVYKLCKALGRIEGLYEKVIAVKGPKLANLKWRLLLDISDTVPECIRDDGKYLDGDILSRVVERLNVCDDIPVRSPDSLRVVFSKVKNKEEYLKEYLKNGSLEGLCILEFLGDFQFLNENVDFDVVNRLVKNVINIHFQGDEDISKLVAKMDVKDSSRNMGHLDNGQEDNHFHKCSSIGPDGNEDILKALLSSLDGVQGKRKIIRGDILNVELNPQEFTREEVEEVFQHSVNVFPKEYMLNTSFTCDLLPLVLKYPEDVEEEKIRKTVCKDSLKLFMDACKDLDLLRSLVFSYDDRSLMEIYLSSDTPPALDLDFYYRLGDRVDRPRVIDYSRILEEYLDSGFIRSMVEKNVINRDMLYNAVVLQLSSLEVPISTSYTNPFYDLDECFYKNVGIREQSQVLLKLRDLYMKIYKGPGEAFLLLLLDAMCDDEDESLDRELRSRGIEDGRNMLGKNVLQSKSTIDRWRGIYLGENHHFVEKVFSDLGLPSRRCSDRKLEQLLERGGPRAIDYVLRKHDVPPQFVASVDFSYLSNEALSRAVSTLELACRKGFPINFVELPFEGCPEFPNADRESADDNLLMLLAKSNYRNLRSLDMKGVVRMIERDHLLSRKEFYRKRHTIYLPLLRSIYGHIADSVLNMYSISRLDMNSVDSEVYVLLRGCFLGSTVLFWDLLLNSLLIVRNISINAFFEKMVGEKEEWRVFLQDAGLEQRSLFAFVFPNIFSSIPKMEVSLDSFILKEASRTIADVTVKARKLTNGFDIGIAYTAGGTLFTALIAIPSGYPYKKPIFTSEIGRKSLLNLRINEMIKKCSKFMELVGLWKINIDEKISGHRECPICYFVIDMHDSSFPSSRCATCKNKFHTRCIVKWAATGARSNCPVCRRPIEITSVKVP